MHVRQGWPSSASRTVVDEGCPMELLRGVPMRSPSVSALAHGVRCPAGTPELPRSEHLAQLSVDEFAAGPISCQQLFRRESETHATSLGARRVVIV